MKRASSIYLTWSVLVGCLVTGHQAFPQSVAISKEQDGIVALLAVSGPQASVGWRFRKPPVTPIEVSATLNYRPLSVPLPEPYPAAGQLTAVIALLDLGDRNRADQIERLKMAMLLLAGRQRTHHQVMFAVYGLEGSFLDPRSDDPRALVDLLMTMPPLDEVSNLSGALIHSIRTLEQWAVDRRAIYVFTDGHNDSEIPLEAVGNLAVSTGVTLTFLTLPSYRIANHSILKHVAESTGGQFVEDAELVEFLKAPFGLIDSGARVRFPLNKVRHYFWQSSPPRLSVSLRYGENVLDLALDIPVTVSGIGDTAVDLIDDHPIAISALGASVVAAMAGLVVLAVRRRKCAEGVEGAEGAEGAEAGVRASLRQPVLALLQNIGDGVAYPIQAPVVHIGRASTNEIVLSDDTVSRMHAVLQQGGDGTFSIENRSGLNGTLVNHLPIEKAPLADGDLITLGSTTLRFCQPAQGNDKSRVAASRQNTPSSASA